MTEHNIEPVYDEHSEILILGSFPSVKSRESRFFYGHPKNRFWKVVSTVYDDNAPQTTDEKRQFLIKRHIAVWDVIKSCDITGSSDSSIRNVVANDIRRILDSADIKRIFVNGRKAEELYRKYIFPQTKREAVCLPSTSPANAAWSIEMLIEEWKIIKL